MARTRGGRLGAQGRPIGRPRGRGRGRGVQIGVMNLIERAKSVSRG